MDCHAHNAATASTFDGTYLSYVHAYFRHVHRAYPFLDKQETLSNAKASTYLNIWADNPDSIILGLVLCIGSTTLERAGKLSVYDRPNMVVPYARILSRCLSSPDLKGLQILTLLSLYSLFDPNGISTWSIVGILTRQAITLGLSRTRTESFPRAMNSHEEELGHRLFWSIFVLDRMLAVSLGHPVGLVDEDMNIPQPALTVGEFASSERAEHASLLQLNRHIIQLRQLEHRILISIHTRGQINISDMSSIDRAAVSRQLRSAIDEWYSMGCLVCLPEADNIPIHSTITWLNARYYNLLILLYYPCQFNSHFKHSSIEELVGCIRKYFKYNYILLENKQLPLNYITLNRLIPACLALMHCFGVIQPCSFSAKAELSNCIDILRAFPEDWLSAHRATEVAMKFLSIVVTHEADAAARLVSYNESDTMPLTSVTKTDLQGVASDMFGIATTALGPTSCYLSLCNWERPELVSTLPPGASATDTENENEQLDVWASANYDFGFL
ncbi:fungal-specific transcription factor domain-containing protein [Paraphoma chrysanthemicola]|nr:fungal-specific transcription factor domain-containing protein [Paraphoma chrysanthemicola]